MEGSEFRDLVPQEDAEQLTESLGTSLWLPQVGRMGWLIGGNITSLAITVGVGLIIARLLGPTDFGAYSVIVVLVTFAVALTTFRLEQHLVKTLGAMGLDDPKWLQPFRDAVTGSGGAGLVTFLSGSVPVTLLLEGTFRSAAYVGLLEVVVAPFFLSRTVLMVRMKQRDLALVALLNRIVWAAAVGVVLLLRPEPILIWVVVSRLVAQLVEVVVLNVRARVGVRSWQWRSGRAPHILGTMRRCLPLVGAGLAGTAYNRIDQPLIALFLGRAQTGLYAGAARLAELVRMLPAVVENVMLPTVARLAHEENRAALRTTLHDATLLMVVPGGLAIAILVGAGEHIMRTLLGSDFTGAGHVVAILAAAELVVFVSATYQMACLALDRRGLILVSTVVGSSLNIGINLALLESFGIVVAAWASLIGYGTASAILTLGMWKVGGVAWAPVIAVARCLPAIAVTSVIATITRDTLVLCMGLSLLTYGLALALSIPGSLGRAMTGARQMIQQKRSPRR